MMHSAIDTHCQPTNDVVATLSASVLALSPAGHALHTAAATVSGHEGWVSTAGLWCGSKQASSEGLTLSFAPALPVCLTQGCSFAAEGIALRGNRARRPELTGLPGFQPRRSERAAGTKDSVDFGGMDQGYLGHRYQAEKGPRMA